MKDCVSLSSLKQLKSVRLYYLGGCLLCVAHGDLVQFEADAIVNVTTEQLLVNMNGNDDFVGIKLEGAIHKACGPKLREACLEIKEVIPDVRCPTGEARITEAYDLKSAKYIIHTVSPMWAKYDKGEAKDLLSKCYRNCLKLADDHQLEKIAFPLISAGLGYSVKVAVGVALESIQAVSKAQYTKKVCFIIQSKPNFIEFEELATKQFDPNKTKELKKSPFLIKGSTFRMNKSQRTLLGLSKTKIPLYLQEAIGEGKEESDSSTDDEGKD